MPSASMQSYYITTYILGTVYSNFQDIYKEMRIMLKFMVEWQNILEKRLIAVVFWVSFSE
jgi:ribosomal protein S4